MKGLSSSDKKAFELFKYYVVLKAYLRGQYDLKRYGGKIKLPFESFEKRSDMRLFYNLNRMRYNHEYIMSNLVDDPDSHISEWLNNERSERLMNNWIKRKESRTYYFKEDVSKLKPDIQESILVKNGEYPKLLKLYNAGDVGIDTLVILNHLSSYLKYWDKKIDDDYIYPNTSKVIDKTSAFIDYDKVKVQQVILDMFDK